MSKRGRILIILAAILSVPIVALLALAGILAYDRGPPQIAEGLYTEANKSVGLWSKAMDEKLSARLAHRFPVGSREAALVAELHEEGFKAEPSAVLPAGQKGLVYYWGSFPCGSVLWVYWTASADGRLTHVEQTNYYACL